MTQEQVSTGLHNKAMLVSLNISNFTGMIKDNIVTDDTNKNFQADSDAGYYSKRRLPKKALKPIHKIVNQARKRHLEMTTPWKDDGYRLLASKGYQDYTDEMRELKRLFFEELDDLKANYESYKAESAKSLGNMYVDAEYPPVEELAAKFDFDIDIQPVPVSDDFRVVMDGSELDKIKKKIKEQESIAQNAATEELWGRLQKVINNVVTIGSNPKAPVYESLMGNIEKVLDQVEKLNITDNADLKIIADEAKKKLLSVYSPGQLRKDKQSKQEAANDASMILDKMAGFMDAGKVQARA